MQRAASASRSLQMTCLAIVAIFVFDVWLFRGHLIDDTFISLRYARNLAEGRGLVFNPGEYVEGYTNPSFVLFSALCFLIGVDAITATRFLSLVSALFLLQLLRGLESMGPRLGDRTLAPYLTLAGPALAYWAVASFETLPFAALFLAALWMLWNEGLAGSGHRSVWLWLVLAYTRPEAPFLFAVSTLAFAAGDALAGAAPRTVARRHALNAALFAGGVAPMFAWRWWYYGSLLPNTFHAKVTGGSEQVLTGLRNVGQWAAAYPLHAAAALGAALLVAATLASRRCRDAIAEYPYIPAIAGIAAAQVAYVAAIGGDFMPYFRFFQPLLPLCSLLLAWALARSARPRLAAAALAVTLLASHLTSQRLVAFVSHRTTVNGVRVGEMLAGQLEPDDWIAVNTVGAIPFYSRLPAIDMLGLTDAEIARRPTYIVSTGWAGHRKGWGRYVLRRRPKLIFFYNTAGSREPFYLGDHELADHPFFRLVYTLKTTVLPPRAGDQPLAIFAGQPFGAAPHAKTGFVRSPELGFQSRSTAGPLPITSVYDAPLVVNTFSRDDRLEPVNLPDPGAATSVDAMIDEALAAWQAAPDPPGGDPAGRAEVEELCASAQVAAEREDFDRARRLLADAMAKNVDLRSPLVYQYVANVAVLTGEPFVAIAAQKEALRLRPANALYRRNLAALLVKPYEELARR